MRGITLRGGDYVVAMEVAEAGQGALLTVTEGGFGKRTEDRGDARVQSRGGVGVINIATTTKNGLVVGVAYVQDGDELLLITQQGMILRMPTNDVRAIGRATQGVTLIDIEADDKVVSIAGRSWKKRTRTRRMFRQCSAAVAGVLAALSVIACGVPPERSIVDEFFAESRLRDKTALEHVATVTFEPRVNGIVESFEIKNVSPEMDKTKTVIVAARAEAARGRDDSGKHRRHDGARRRQTQ